MTSKNALLSISCSFEILCKFLFEFSANDDPMVGIVGRRFKVKRNVRERRLESDARWYIHVENKFLEGLLDFPVSQPVIRMNGAKRVSKLEKAWAPDASPEEYRKN